MAQVSQDLPQELERLAALTGSGLLDAPAGEELEAAVRLAAVVAGVPHATLNLIDGSRQCQLTTVGFEGADSARSDSMCARHFLSGGTVHLPDASTSPDYADSPWVDGRLGGVRLYASVPLVVAGGHALGTLCVFDTAPGELSAAQLASLEDVAAILVSLFERRRQARLNAQLAAEAEEQRGLAEITMAELEARQELTDAVLDTIDVGIVAAGPDGRLTLFNRTARRWHGLDADPDLDPGEHADRYALYDADGTAVLAPDQVPLTRALTEGVLTGAEMVIAPPGLPPRAVVVSGRAMTRSDGTRLGAVVALMDVTADRAGREALLAAHAALTERGAELERSNADLERFAAVAAHDLRSPLTVIDGYLELLDDVHGDRLPEQARGWIATSRRGVQRMQALTGALLAYAQAGAQTCSSELADTGEVLDQAVVDLRSEIDAAGVTLTTGGPLPLACCDPVLLRQLLQNLLANAVKYRHPARPCRIDVSASWSQDAEQQGTWTFAVADNGRGVPAADRDRVFTMFTTAGAAPSGHGIGLATCQRIVERHGGRIRLDETPGGGTTARFTLPGQAAAPPDRPTRPTV